jgi:hypothetical protein
MRYANFTFAVKKERTASDKAFVKIDNDTISTIELCKDKNTGGWQRNSVSLNAYVGRTVTLHFIIELNNDDQISNWFIDDVTLCDNSPAHPCP